MDKMKLSKEEKTLIKAIVNWGIYCNYQKMTENDVRAVTLNNNMEHRKLVNAYIDKIRPNQFKEPMYE